MSSAKRMRLDPYVLTVDDGTGHTKSHPIQELSETDPELTALWTPRTRKIFLKDHNTFFKPTASDAAKVTAAWNVIQHLHRTYNADDDLFHQHTVRSHHTELYRNILVLCEAVATMAVTSKTRQGTVESVDTPVVV
eukprot:PhF_6_TR12274/c0_g1_i2/m.19464